MTCHRADGTITGQRSGEFFVRHDIHHYAVETTLGLDRAFYGYVAKGWDIQDFGTPWPKGKMADEDFPQLMLAEMFAAALDRDQFGDPLTAGQLNGQLQQYSKEHSLASFTLVSENELNVARKRVSDILSCWQALPEGQTMELRFPTGDRA